MTPRRGSDVRDASISTSAPLGSPEIWTVERAGGRSPTWLRVHLVHRGEVAEVHEEDGRLDELVEPASRRLEDRTEVRP